MIENVLTLLTELIALLGHAMLWIWCINQIHSTSLHRRLLDLGVHCATLVLVALPCWAAWYFCRAGIVPFGGERLHVLPVAARAYLYFCVVLCGIGVVVWGIRRLRRRDPSQLLSTKITRFDFRKVGQPAADQTPWAFRCMVNLPLNEVLCPNLVEREVVLSRLPPELDGLTVIHLTDMHINGRIGWGYFEEVIALSNRQQPDFVMITGDLLDRTTLAEPLAERLSRLEARVGRYFILGNHDRRIDHQHLRRCISQAGLIDLSGYCDLVTVRGHQLLIAGNEAPWFLPAGDFDAVETYGATGETRPLRILLSHSPDQIEWAVAKDVDLMLAGHLHGGQIGLPLVGPIRSPSRYGFKYIGGVYYRDPTVLSVSCGISGELPIRWNCPPELVKLVLRSKQGASRRTHEEK